MKILILGDSFSHTHWANNTYDAWPELLTNDFDVTNMSVCGSSVWWSYQQFLKHKSQYDYCIFVVSTYTRVYIESRNWHLNANTTTPINGTTLEDVYYDFFYSEEREKFFHNAIIKELLLEPNVLIVPAFAESIPDHQGWSLCHFSDTEAEFYNQPLPILDDRRRKCHLGKESNIVIYQKVLNAISKRDKILQLDQKDFVNPTAPKTYYWS